MEQQTLFPEFCIRERLDKNAPFSVKMQIWRTRHKLLHQIADRIRAEKIKQAAVIWQAAFKSAIPPHNCVHNAAIDDALHGWCRTREQLRAAKKANELLNDWTASKIAARGSRRIWNQLFPTGK